MVNRNPFKELEKSLMEAPPEMKKKVMNDVAAAKLLMEMASLFTSNYSSILEGLLKMGSRED